MGQAGRIAYWLFLFAGVGCLCFAVYILLAWPAPHADPLATWTVPKWAFALMLAWFGAGFAILARLTRHLFEDLE